MNTKKQNSRWRNGAPRYSESRVIEDESRGDAAAETEWIARRKEQKGWRNGAKVRS